MSEKNLKQNQKPENESAKQNNNPSQGQNKKPESENLKEKKENNDLR